MIKKIVIFSQSDIKLKAVAQEASQPDVFVKDSLIIKCLEPGDTGCPQPVLLENAYRCIDARIAPHLPLIKGADDSTLFIAIENYISVGEKYHDNVAVVLCHEQGLWRYGVGDVKDAQVQVPEEFQATAVDDLRRLGPRQILGCAQTLGKRIQAAHPECPHDDWFQFASPTNMSRQEQIGIVLQQAFSAFASKLALRQSMAIYKNFPKIGIPFVDIFPPLASPDLISLMAQIFESSRTAPAESYFFAGVESRGLIIAAMLAAKTGLPFVACRKFNKLPRDEARAIVSVTYKTEYSFDTLELQPAHLLREKRLCVLVDDVLATGGSICAAASLLQQQKDISIALVLVLCDIEPLRREWQERLIESLPSVPVHVVL